MTENMNCKAAADKLILSLRETENLPRKVIRCPYCGYTVAVVYPDAIGHMEVRCRKCKFSGPINLEYFK